MNDELVYRAEKAAAEIGGAERWLWFVLALDAAGLIVIALKVVL